MTKISLTRSAGRAGLAAGAAALLAFGLAAPAAAEAARGVYTGNAETGVEVRMDGDTVGTNLFNLELEDGTVLTAYCIDLETGIRGGAGYEESAWENYPGRGDFAEPARVHWILQNSYPEITAAELAEAAGVDNARFGDAEALGATQAAIWHFSNGADMSAQAPNGVREVYDYLVGAADDLPQTAEPDASLSITPGTAEGEAGGIVGEFEIASSAADIPVTLGEGAPEGVELVDIETGEKVETVNDGDTVGFSVPEDAEDGSASFSLSTTATVEVGRLFLGDEESSPTQTLITAEGGETEVSATATANWTAGGETPPTDEPSEEPSEQPSEEPTPTPGPTPSEQPSPTPSATPSAPADDNNSPRLPVTGGALAGLVAAGVAALAAGGGAIYLSRRRKAADTTDVEG